jgi:hypothetical protein
MYIKSPLKISQETLEKMAKRRVSMNTRGEKTI